MIKKGDFVEIEYTGKTKDDNVIFDTTDEEVAKKNNIHSELSVYGPIIICIGQGQLLKGLDHQLEGKEPGKYTFDMKPEDAFGKKSAKLVRLIPISKFQAQKITPEPGLIMEIDGNTCAVKRVSGGRVLVDFNHPLSGKDLEYDMTVKRMVTDKKEQIQSLLTIILSVKEATIDLTEDKAAIKIQGKQFPKPVMDKVEDEIKKLVGLAKVDITLE